jgi:hypothetical protein
MGGSAGFPTISLGGVGLGVSSGVGAEAGKVLVIAVGLLSVLIGVLFLGIFGS